MRITATHILGVTNNSADMLSRNQARQFLKAHPQASPILTLMLLSLLCIISPSNLDWTYPSFLQEFQESLSWIQWPEQELWTGRFTHKLLINLHARNYFITCIIIYYVLSFVVSYNQLHVLLPHLHIPPTWELPEACSSNASNSFPLSRHQLSQSHGPVLLW